MLRPRVTFSSCPKQLSSNHTKLLPYHICICLNTKTKTTTTTKTKTRMTRELFILCHFSRVGPLGGNPPSLPSSLDQSCTNHQFLVPQLSLLLPRIKFMFNFASVKLFYGLFWIEIDKANLHYNHHLANLAPTISFL